MTARVICISRTLAAGGVEVGRFVAESLGYRFLDDEVITLAAEKAQVDPREFAAVEHRESVLERVLDALTALMARAPTSPLGLTRGVSDAPGARQPPVREEARRLIREVIVEVAKQGNVVIVAHAASIPLAGNAGVLRVLITAPPHIRARRLELDVRIVSEREAAKTIEDSDRARLTYLHDFYGVSDETPTLYDLVINTEVLDRQAAADIIVAAAEHDIG
jgi:cytidylate kinase